MEPPSKLSPGAIASDHQAPEATKRRAGVGGRRPQDVAERGAADRLVGIHDPELRFVLGIDLEKFENAAMFARCVPGQVVMHDHTDACRAERLEIPLHLVVVARHRPILQGKGLPATGRDAPAEGAVLLGLEGGGEIGDVLVALVEQLAVLRVHLVHRVAQDDDDSGVRSEGADLAGPRRPE